MPHDNLDTARRFLELGREEDWAGQAELLAEDVVYRPIREITETGERHGRQSYRSYMETFFEGEWAENLSIEDASFRDHDDAVVIRLKLTGEGRGSGLDFDARVFQVLTFADGVIVRVEDFLDRAEALRAAGAIDSP